MTTAEQKSDIALKNLLFNVSSTAPTRKYFEEPYVSRQFVYPNQIIGGTIPNVAPLGTPLSGTAGISGDVELIKNLQLLSVPGTLAGFYHVNLKNAVPFNYGNGSYLYALTLNGGSTTPIAFGSGSWIVDPAGGTLTFYGTLPVGVSAALPPKISFYKYIGILGAIPSVAADPVNLTNVNVGTSGTVTMTSLSNNTAVNNAALTIDKPIAGSASFVSLVDSEAVTFDGNIISLKGLATRAGAATIGDRFRLVGPHTVNWDSNTLLMRVEVPASVNGVSTAGSTYYIPIVRLT